jgi:sterol desaturase/sphingolipid hydroxylase (fatty acid hydroxylase superfamily)
MTDAWFELFGPSLQPDWHTVWLVVFWALLALFAWIETVIPAGPGGAPRERRWPTNFALGLINMIIVPLAPVSGLLGAEWAQEHGWGLLNLRELPFWLVLLATLLLRSLIGYVFHLILHKVHALWRMHRVHHSDDHLDISTALRSHPLEFAALLVVLAPLAVVLGLDPWTLAAYEITESAFSVFGHAHIRLPDWLDRPLRYVFVTPNMHVIHHSSWQPETDSNYGQVFSFWDRLFGTYSEAPRNGYAGMQIGLDEMRGERAADFWLQVKSPAWRSLRQ